MPIRSLRDGQVRIADAGGTGGSNVVTVDVEDGDLSFTERDPVNIISDRGVLDHARLANEEPVELSFSMKFQSLTTHAAPTPYEALRGINDASAWVSDEPNSDTYATILEFTINNPVAGGNNEILTFARFHCEERSFSEGDPNNTLSVSGRAVITAPSIAS